METKTIGSIRFTTATAIALWTCEVSGQLSDGYWENARPHNHWMVWFHLNVDERLHPQAGIVLDEGIPPQFGQRTRYNVLFLMNMMWEPTDPQYAKDPYILRSRMLRMGRMAKAAQALGRRPYGTQGDQAGMSEYMPDTYEEWAARKADDKWEHGYISVYMAKVDDDLARAYYAAIYSVKELRADLRDIKAAMASLPTSFPVQPDRTVG